MKSAASKLLLGLIILNSILVSILSLVPPISRDALVHHLAVPKLYLEHGGIFELPCMSYSYFPMNLNLLYMIPLYFGNDIAPKFIHFSFALLTGALIYIYLKKRLSTAYGLFGAFLYLSLPIIIKLSITVYVDLGLAFFSFAALIMIFEWVNARFKIKYLIFSGVFCGLAIGTKYNGLITFLILSLFIPFLYSRFNRNTKNASSKALLYCIAFIMVSSAVFSPWGVRNYKWKGNPFYPLYNKHFNLKNDNPCIPLYKIKYSKKTHIGKFEARALLYDETPLDMFLLPVRVFFQGKDNDFKYFDGRLSPLLFFLSILACVNRKNQGSQKYELNILLFFSIIFVLIPILSTVIRIRYFLPAIPCLTILSVYGIKNAHDMITRYTLGRKTFFLSVFYICISGFIIFHNGGYFIKQFNYVKPFDYISGKLSKDEYISMFRNEYPAMIFMNKNLPENANVLFIYNGKRGYYSNRNYIPDEGKNLHALYSFIQSLKHPFKIKEELKQRGITHLFLNNRFVKKRISEDLSKREHEIFITLMTKYTKKLYDEFGYSLYQL